MSSQAMNRRQFQSLSAAALGGLLTGALAGCGEPPAVGPKATGGAAKTDSAGVDIFASDIHVCRGLNTCKGKGAGGKNECAGQGDCATPSTHHECGGHNECKGQGGCGETAARNSCKGQGKCHVPLMAAAWKDARGFFEAEMKKAGKEVGEAPKKK